MKYSLVLLVLVLVTHSPALAQQAFQDAYGLTAYRPQHGTGYHPFTRTAVPEAFEEHRFLGPGIRVNHADEWDPEVEDDLIELVVTRSSADATFALERSDTSLSVWKTRRKLPQTEVAFTNNRSTPLAFGEAHMITLWVEWTGAAPAFPTLSLLALGSDVGDDLIVFHAFTGLVVALGGEGQEPDYPVDVNHGTYRVATTLYERGWDVLMRDEDEVDSDGSGLVYDEVVNAIQNRYVRELAVFGYSHGGGSTYDLCERLVATSLNPFSVRFTAYVDSIKNGSSDPLGRALTFIGVDSNTDPETRRPPASDFHLNFYQNASFADGYLNGGPVARSIPPLDGLDLNIEESANWDMTAHHFDIDDFDRVHDFIRAELTARVSR